MEPLLSRAHAFSPQDPQRFTFGGKTFAPTEVVDVLRPYVTEARQARIDDVIAGRTYAVATVVEGLINAGNVSAVMRSAEALGFQAFHVVTSGERFKRSPRTTQGADKWLDVLRWETPAACAGYLRAHGYRIAVTHLDDTAVPIDRLDFTEPTALVFGNEAEGLSAAMLAEADVRCVVPMAGFVQSFNISVAAAVCLYHAYRDRLARQDHHGDLTREEAVALRALFYLRSVNKAGALLRKAASP